MLRLVAVTVLLVLGGCDVLFRLDSVSSTDAGAGGDGSGDAPSTRVIFVTSEKFLGDFRVSGADNTCATEATTARLQGTFVAWLSTSSESAATRAGTVDLPFVLPDGTHIAESWSDLIDGTLAHPINQNQSRGAEFSMPDGCDVWTGTSPFGLYSGTISDGTDSCSNWSDNSTASKMSVGTLSSMGNAWTSNPSCTTNCGTSLHLYCIQK